MIRRLLGTLGLFILAGTMAQGQYVTLTGTLQAANGLVASNYTLAFQPSQIFYIAGTAVVINTTAFCATSTDGTVVGTGNPLYPLVGSVGFTGTLPPATYFIQYTWFDASGNVTLPSPEQRLQLTATGRLVLSPPVQGMPATAAGTRVYIGTSSGSETFQGQTSGSATYIQSTPLGTGGSLPTTNTTVCKMVANDAGWPTGTGYNVTFTDPSGNTVPGYPMLWRLLGPGTTLNLSNGLPIYNGLVTYPVPILSVPYNHTPQSISGPLSLTNYNLTDVAALGVGTGFPAWGVDVEGSGLLSEINAKGGYLVNGEGGTDGECLASDGTAYDTSVACITAASLFYQTVDASGTPLTQRPTLNFDSTLSTTDSSSPARTNVGLPNKGTAGSCTYCSVTFDAQGRETGYSSNPTPGGTDDWSTFNGCTFASDATHQNCTVAVSFATTMPDTSYFIQCTQTYNNDTEGGDWVDLSIGQFFTGLTTTGFTYNENSGNNSALSTQFGADPTYGLIVTCHAHHL